METVRRLGHLLLAAGLVLLTGCGQTPPSSESQVPALPAEAAATQATVPSATASIAYPSPTPTPPVAAGYPSPTPTTAGPSMEDIKRANLEAALQRSAARATALAGTPRPTPHPPPPPGWTPAPVSLPLGILGSRGPGRGGLCECVFENAWRGIVHGGYMDIYAGALHADPQRGLVMIITSTLTLQYEPGAILIGTPRNIGSVHFVNADSNRLTLSGPGGASFVFDADTLAWQAP